MNLLGIKIDKDDFRLWADVFPRISRDFKSLLDGKALAVAIAGPIGNGPARVDDREVGFNNPAPKTGESFLVGRTLEVLPGSNYFYTGAKTYGLPYAKAVKAFLTLARWHAGDAVEVVSDEATTGWEEVVVTVGDFLNIPVSADFVLNASWLEYDFCGKILFYESHGRSKEDPMAFFERLQAFYRWNTNRKDPLASYFSSLSDDCRPVIRRHETRPKNLTPLAAGNDCRFMIAEAKTAKHC